MFENEVKYRLPVVILLHIRGQIFENQEGRAGSLFESIGSETGFLDSQTWMCAVCVRDASILVALQMAAMKTANKELKQTYKTMKIEDVEVGTRAHCSLL